MTYYRVFQVSHTNLAGIQYTRPKAGTVTNFLSINDGNPMEKV